MTNDSTASRSRILPMLGRRIRDAVDAAVPFIACCGLVTAIGIWLLIDYKVNLLGVLLSVTIFSVALSAVAVAKRRLILGTAGILVGVAAISAILINLAPQVLIPVVFSGPVASAPQFHHATHRPGAAGSL